MPRPVMAVDGPGFQAVQVVGGQWSARAHELRDLLARNKVGYGFLPADSERLTRRTQNFRCTHPIYST